MYLKLNGREVEVTFDTNGREMEDIFISSGFYTDTNEDLTDEELDLLQNENEDALYEAWLDMNISAADAMVDRMGDY